MPLSEFSIPRGSVRRAGPFAESGRKALWHSQGSPQRQSLQGHLQVHLLQKSRLPPILNRLGFSYHLQRQFSARLAIRLTSVGKSANIQAERIQGNETNATGMQGIKTPKHEIDLIKDRLKRLKEMLR